MWHQALARVDAFLRKAGGVNEPLQAFYETPEFARMEKILRVAIMKQAEYAAGHIREGRQIAEPQPISVYVSPDELFPTLKAAFELAVVSQYKRWGVRMKAEEFSFTLTNQNYIDQLYDMAAYLLKWSKISETTFNQITSIIADGKQIGLTNAEIAESLVGRFEDVSRYRAILITRTEVANAMSQADLVSMWENGVKRKRWIVAGPGGDACDENEADGWIGVHERHSTGVLVPPQHPNCGCYEEAEEIDLNDPSLVLWDGA